MALWREALHASIARNARDAADYLKILPNQVLDWVRRLGFEAVRFEIETKIN